MFERFLKTEARSSQVGDASPLSKGVRKASNNSGRMDRYKDDRNRCDLDSSSRMRFVFQNDTRKCGPNLIIND